MILPAHTPTVEVKMLIRKNVGDVFMAFIDPSITTNFWFTKSSGVLKAGKQLTWEWEMYGVSTQVHVKEIVRDSKIIFDWGEPLTTVEIEFRNKKDGTTYVIIKNYGFNLKGDELMHALQDSTSGFTTVIDGLKSWLEHNLNLNLIADKFPNGK